MKKVIDDLLELQNVDDAIDILNDNGGHLPDKIKKMDEKQKQREKDIAEKKDKLQELDERKKKASFEREVTLKNLKKYEKQLNMVRSNREYEALIKEMDYAEFHTLELEEEIDKIKENIKEQKEIIKKTEEKYEQEKKEYEEKREKLQEELDTLEDKLEIKYDERKRVKARLPRRIVSEYERIRKGTKGKAVVQVVDGSCGGCYYNLPPQTVLDAKKQNKIMHCEGCGRILVWSEE